VALLLLLAAGGPSQRGAGTLEPVRNHGLVDESVAVTLAPAGLPPTRVQHVAPCVGRAEARVLPRWRTIVCGGLPAPRAPDA